MGRTGIENLRKAKPKKYRQRNDKGRPERLSLELTISDKKRKIYDGYENILAKKNGHVIAQILACQIFKEQPSQKEIKAIAPVLEYSHHDRGAGKDQSNVEQCDGIVLDDVIRDLKDRTGREKKGAPREDRASAKLCA